MEIYLARQPIFDRWQRVIGYELFFRAGLENFFDFSCQDMATAQVIVNSYILMGMQDSTGGKRAFINFTPDLLRKQYPTLFPPQLIGIEILESVEPEDDIIKECQILRENGYLIALDDFVLRPGYLPFVNLAHIIKVDFLNTDLKERKYLIDTFRPKGKKCLLRRLKLSMIINKQWLLATLIFKAIFFVSLKLSLAEISRSLKAVNYEYSMK